MLRDITRWDTHKSTLSKEKNWMHATLELISALHVRERALQALRAAAYLGGSGRLRLQALPFRLPHSSEFLQQEHFVSAQHSKGLTEFYY